LRRSRVRSAGAACSRGAPEALEPRRGIRFLVPGGRRTALADARHAREPRATGTRLHLTWAGGKDKEGDRVAYDAANT